MYCVALALLTSVAVAPVRVAGQASFPPGVLATGTMGPTNPPQPTLGTPINQSSMARLLSLNSVDDFCLFAPPTLQDIADSETVEVAWCTKPRNNARVIPDGTITGASFIKTDFYVQLIGFGDLTRLNIPAGDFGGELDPHGALGDGNPVGGNVTSNIVTGTDENFAEWMLYIGNDQFCFRICTNANSTYSAANMCWHELDEMGCGFVMPGNYDVQGTFESCEGDVAYPPGWYPTATINDTPQFSTFAQRFTGTLPGGSVYTIGDLSTPSAPFSTPSSSNCITTSTIANGIDLQATAPDNASTADSPTVTTAAPDVAPSVPAAATAIITTPPNTSSFMPTPVPAGPSTPAPSTTIVIQTITAAQETSAAPLLNAKAYTWKTLWALVLAFAQLLC